MNDDLEPTQSGPTGWELVPDKHASTENTPPRGVPFDQGFSADQDVRRDAQGPSAPEGWTTDEPTPYPWAPASGHRAPWPQPGAADPATPWPQPGAGGPATPWPGGGGHWGSAGMPPGGYWQTPPPPYHAPQPPKRHRLRALAVAMLVLAVLAGILIGRTVWQPTSNNQALPSSNGGSNGVSNGASTPPPQGSQGSNGSSNASGGPSDVSSIAAGVDPGLVDINTTLGYQSEEAAGTGMVLTSNGEVLTNNHVITGATKISVTDIGNGHTYNADVTGYDRTSDVAVLQLQDASGLQTVTTANSSNLSVGQAVVGIGNAQGEGGTPSAVGGSVTALNQSITASDESDGTSEQLSGLIQTNANIQPGDSGGPLVTTSGQVMGMDTAASSTSGGFQIQGGSNQAFSIPINTALSIAKQIESGQASTTVHLGQTGFLGVEVSPDQGSSSGSNGGGFGGLGGLGNGLGGLGNGSGSSTSGAQIEGTVSGSPAAQAGLGQGDVITAIDGHNISSANDLSTQIEQYHPGDTVSVQYTDSSGQSHTVSITLASGPAG